MDTELFATNPELGRTSPDYVIYVPKGTDERIPDTGNEHFLVFRRKDGTFAAVWTQSGHEGQYNQHIVFAESDASARSWSAPRIIAGEKFDPETGRDMCSWGYPLVSRSGRIYVLYSKHIGVNDVFTHTTGRLAGIYSDDNGKSWSAEAYPDFPRSEYDSPDPAMPGNCITWQKPLRFGDGRYLAGITRWISPARATPSDGNWIHAPSVVDFLRFENLDDDPEIPDLKLTLLTAGKSLRFPIPDDPRGNSLIQEPTLNELPDGRLFAVMRTVAGTAAWSVSADGGESWSEPETLRYGDGLPPVEQPLSPCPCYTLSEGEYVLFYHNHDGHYGPWIAHATETRRPICMAYGKFDPEGRQPVRFSAPLSWIDSDNIELNHRCDLAMYSSFEYVDGRPVLFFPDRKHFLVGKVIDRARLANAVFPKKRA
ncbi:exo-alpha-sialidase [bacterium]|nr:exo-alpha-sialidase [bacterium]